MNPSTTTDESRNPKTLAARVFLATLMITMLAGTSVLAQTAGLMFYGLEDGEVRGLDMQSGGDSGITIPASAFFGSPPSPATGRNIAYDPATDLLWYSASDNHVHSLMVSTLAAGPTISDIGDAFYGATRTIAIDINTRRLYVSNSNGAVEVYVLTTNTKWYTIPLAAFGLSEPNPGNRRRLAADGDGDLWYAAADGTFKEFDTFQFNPHFTGREIPVSEQIEPGTPGQNRAFVAVRWPSGEHHLYYATSDSSVRTANLDTLTNVTMAYPASWFWTSTNPGALRSLAIDPTWAPPGNYPAMPTGITATDGQYLDRVEVSWNPDPSWPIFWLFRRESGTSGWPWSMVCFNNGWCEDTYAVPGVTYEYTVKACNTSGCSDYGIHTDTGYVAAILPPTGVTASQGTYLDRVRLNWNTVAGATGYRITAMPYNGGTPTIMWVSGTTWDDMGALPAGSLWEYWVEACTSPSFCSSSTTSVWGWIGTYIFVDDFESGDLSRWSSVQH